MQLRLVQGLDIARLAKYLTLLLVLFALGVISSEVIDIKARIRQAKHQAVVNTLRANILEMWVKQQVLPHEHRVMNVNAVNPMRLMVIPPEHYIGEFQQTPSDMTDAWYFDVKKKRLVYVSESGVQEVYRMAASSNAIGNLGCWNLVKE